MTLFPKIFKLSTAALAATMLMAAAAPAPSHIDVKAYTKVEDVVVPLPNEVLGALDKLGSVNWKEYVRVDRSANFMERPRTALVLGSVIADGFIAVQAKDAPAVKDIGQRVLALSKAIGVGNSITPHAKAIIESADKNRWDSVRTELDQTQNKVQEAMNELNDQRLSQLVSLGGWLRGTEVLTAVVKKNFSVNGAELLHQPDLLAYFQQKLQAMPESKTDLLKQIHTALVEVKPLIDVGPDQRISPESVKKVNDITTKLDNAIVTKQ